MTNPETTAAMTNNNTDPAAMSFAWPMRGLNSLLILSESFSIAVLKPSAMKTPPIHNEIMHHSMGER